jgi:2-polyprenyl-6-methoxyphenol hydroxylase-like FAD-dependent oxidoreductase
MEASQLNAIKKKNADLFRFKKNDATIRWQADVVIVGGAVAGAAMACACAEQGVSSIVLERTSVVKAINRGDLLSPLSLAFCERWGVLEELRNLGAYQFNGFTFHSPRIGYLGSWDFTSLPFRFNYCLTLSHPKIHTAMYRAIAKSTQVQVYRGATVHSLTREGDQSVGVLGTYQDEMFYATGRVVVAADGMDSAIRTEIGIPVQEPYRYNQEYLMLEVPKPQVEALDHWGLQYLGRKGLTVLIPLDGDRLRIPIGLPIGGLSKWQRLPAQEVNRELISRAPVLEGTDVGARLGTVHSYRVYWQHAEQYVRKGVCLIGDSAHVSHPSTAQGMNMALLDAEVLAAVVKHGLKVGDLSDEVLRLYEKARWPIAERTMRTSHQQAMHHTATGLLQDLWGVRRYRWAERDPVLKHDLVRGIAGLKNPTAATLNIPEAIEVRGLAEALQNRV